MLDNYYGYDSYLQRQIDIYNGDISLTPDEDDDDHYDEYREYLEMRAERQAEQDHDMLWGRL